MTVVDTSALMAIVFGEPDAPDYEAALGRGHNELSAASLTEALLVARGREDDPRHTALLEDLLARFIDRIVPVDERHARAAFAAWLVYGKGRHPAGLNVGDCFSYAVAKLADAPLLFKGDDFSQTDMVSAID